MSWLFRWLGSAKPRRVAFGAICLSTLGCALWGAAWIGSPSSGARADRSNARVFSDSGSEATFSAGRQDLAQQCAAIGDSQPAALVATRIDPFAPYADTGVGLPEKSDATVWLQEGPRDPGVSTIREMSPINPQTVNPQSSGPLVRTVDPKSKAGPTSKIATARGAGRPSGPVVRRTPVRNSTPADAMGAPATSPAQSTALPDAVIRLPGSGDENNPRGSLEISAVRDSAIAPPVVASPLAANVAGAVEANAASAPPISVQAPPFAPPAQQAPTANPAPAIAAAAPSAQPPAAMIAAAPSPDVAAAPAPAVTSASPAGPPYASSVAIAQAPTVTAIAAATPSTGSAAPPVVTAPVTPPRASSQLPGQVEHAIPAAPRQKTVEESSVGLLNRVIDRSASASAANATSDGSPQSGAAAPPAGMRPPVQPPSAEPPPRAVPPRAQPTAAGPRRTVPPQRGASNSQSSLPPPPRSMAPISASEASRHMAIISKRAQEHVDYGFDLAERGALYSAEVEFTQSLLLVSQALDAQYRTQFHSRAIANGLTALREADDFVPRAGQMPGKLEDIIATHKTPVWHGGPTEDLPPLVAMQRYYAYAQQQLMVASGSDPSAAMALYGLGRLQTALASEQGVKKITAGPKAMALYQATMGVDPQNYLAANELGVMLARYGQLQEAEAALRRSVEIAPRPENWQNLAAVYDRMGNIRSAQHARAQHQLALASTTRPGRVTNADRPPLKFVDNETFARQSGAPGADDMLAANKADSKPASAAPAAPESKSGLGWLGDKMSDGMARVVGPPKPQSTQVR